jgi:cyclic pyranopterin phosphate synthase
VGNTNRWRLDDVVSASEIVARISAEMPLEPLPAHYRGEVARRFRHRHGGGEIGVISSVTQPFCRDCTRARLTADGRLYTCLFASAGHDLRAPLRGGASDAQLAAIVRAAWNGRADRYSELRASAPAPRAKVEMSAIGG